MTVTAVGIDLGTTYSCVAIWRHDSVEIIANDQGNRITPSYVAFNDTERLIGEAAKSQSTLNPTNTIFDVKRLIGRRFNDAKVQEDMKMWPFKVISIDGKPKIRVQYRGEEKNFTPEEISSMVLIKMIETASAYLGEKITNAVVTVPAYFNDSQRQATKDAATIAGLEILRILNEPTAAALAYGLDQHLTGERRILVFDLGGGTFDVSVLFVDDGSLYEVKATAGDTHLGGEDFDNRLVNYFAKDFLKKHQKDVKTNPRALRRLKTAAERAKRILSSTTETTIEIDALFEGIDFYTKISRARFEELCSDLFRGTLGPVEKALADSKYDKKSIDDVIMVGGSTRIPKLQSILQNFFDGKPLSFSINPDEAVAYGAAVQAAILIGNSNKDIQNVLLVDVTPLSLGIATSGDIMTKIIRRNSRIPCKRSEKFTTHMDNQSGVTIKVYQGERTMCRHNNLLGIFDLTGIPPAPRGCPRIRVTFDINANGIMKVSAQEKHSGTYKNIVIRNDKGRLTNTEINQMIKEAEMFHLNDARERKRVQARGKFEEYLLRMKQTFKGFPDGVISEEEKGTVLRELHVYHRWLDHNPGTDLEDYATKWHDIKRNIEPILVKLHQDSLYPNCPEQCQFEVD